MKNSDPTISQVTFNQIQAAARRAIINANPDYYSWTEEEQEHYRATKDEQASLRSKVALINELLGIKCEITTVNAVWDELPDTNLDIINWAMLLTDGVGDDNIFVNESFALDKSILDFNTLYDYDFDNHLFQESSRRKRQSNYKPSDYYPFHWEPWVRLIVNNVFFYANLSSTGRYITDQLEDFGVDFIHQLIPHEYEEGKDHGKSDNGGYLQWDMQVNASGLEGQLEELENCWHIYLEERFIAINKEQLGCTPSAHIVDVNEKQVCDRTYIFNNEDALKSVRWKHFVADCQTLIKTDNSVDILLSSEKQRCQEFLHKALEDIMKNYNPNIVKFEKKMKVMMPSEMLENFNDPE